MLRLTRIYDEFGDLESFFKALGVNYGSKNNKTEKMCMEIIDKRDTTREVFVQAVRIGDVFGHAGDIYLKTNKGCFSVKTRIMVQFEDNTLITPVKATLTIERLI